MTRRHRERSDPYPLQGPAGRECGCGSAVADLVDEVLLVQLRIAVQVEFLGACVEFVDGPVLVGRRFPTGLGDGAAAPVRGGVGDAGGLFLGLAVVAEFLVEILILQLRLRVLFPRGMTLLPSRGVTDVVAP